MTGTVKLLDGFVATSAAAGSGFGGGLINMLPFVAILAIMYFLMIRPQQKKEKQRQAMVASLKRGDRVLTTGGLIGTIHKVAGDGELSIEVAEGIRVRLLAGAVSQLLDKTSTVHAAKEDVSDSDEGAESDKEAKKATPKKATPKKAVRKTTTTRRKKADSE